jgi:hypothetical protein
MRANVSERDERFADVGAAPFPVASIRASLVTLGGAEHAVKVGTDLPVALSATGRTERRCDVWAFSERHNAALRLLRVGARQGRSWLYGGR